MYSQEVNVLQGFRVQKAMTHCLSNYTFTTAMESREGNMTPILQMLNMKFRAVCTHLHFKKGDSDDSQTHPFSSTGHGVLGKWGFSGAEKYLPFLVGGWRPVKVTPQ